jgi:hypothetical protein
MHGLEQQQQREIHRNDDNQSANERLHHEFTTLFHQRPSLHADGRDHPAFHPG